MTPQGVDVPHALVVVLRRFGPETIDAQLADLSEHMRGCYTSSLTFLMTPRHDYMTMTIDAQAGDTSVELEPQNISPLATCLVHSLVDSRFDAGSHHVVLTIDATLWFEATTSQPL